MKKLFALIALLVLGSVIYGQAPSGFTYQAILKDAAGTARANATVTVKFEILQESSSGSVVYSETHSTTTSELGVINLNLGLGTPVSGTLSGIDWGTGVYFLRITVDNVLLGTSQLLSVPYALFSSKSGDGFSGDYNDLTNKPDLTIGAVKKMTVMGETSDLEEALFEVKNKDGQTVFAVYSEGVRIYVDNSTAKGSKGGFAIGGFESSKAGSQDLLVVNPDSIRMYIAETPVKGAKGGFAIGGFATEKSAIQNLLVVNSDSIRAYIDTNNGKGNKGGFAIGGFEVAKGQGDEYLRVTRDSTRVYINNTETKAAKGGFAIGGFADSKGVSTDYLLINPDSTNFYVRSQNGGGSSTFNIFSLNENLNQHSLLTADADTIDLSGVLNLQNNINVFGDIGFTGAVTQLLAPTLSTVAPTSVTENSAQGGGSISSNGGAAIIVSGLVWSTSPNPTKDLPTKTTNGTTSGSFTSSITGLAANTTYYLRAYATNSIGTGYGNEVTFITLGVGGTVSDYDGNVYNTVVIGAQTWMAENLKTTKLNDGTPIIYEKDSYNWSSLYSPGYCWYNNDSVVFVNSGYGMLYNWFAVEAGNLCPIGWHVPTVADFDSLTFFLGGSAVAGGKLKEAGLANWLSPNTDATNETGFTALPGGSRMYIGDSQGLSESAYWWSSEKLVSEASYANAHYNGGEFLVLTGFFDQEGLSVRCLQGEVPVRLADVFTQQVSYADFTYAIIGGEVMSEGGGVVTARGVCWSTSPNPTISDSKTIDGAGPGFFNSTMSGLTPGTTYYVRAYATNSAGTAYGNEVTFDSMYIGK